MKNNYAFPAIFSFDDDGISIEFPDLPGCFSCADTLDEAIANAKDVLGLFLYTMETDGMDIPEPTPPTQLDVPKGSSVYITDVYMPYFRQTVRDANVKKTLTIPAWLNFKAEEAGINFSKLLREALTAQLGL